MKKYIHVNQNRIKSNAKHGRNDPVISVKTYKSNDYTNEISIHCSCGCNKIVAIVKYSPDKPLSCGARAWVELVDGEVYV